MTIDNDRWERGFATFTKVYGEQVTGPERGEADFFDLVIIGQQFAEVWSRDALAIEKRRLLTMGVLAAQQRFDILQIQFERVLTTGEMTPEEVRETVIHLITYVGAPSSGDLYQAGEQAIAAHTGASEQEEIS